MTLATLGYRPETKTESMEGLVLSFDPGPGTYGLLCCEICGGRVLFAHMALIPHSGIPQFCTESMPGKYNWNKTLRLPATG